jgi:hypothetical protein
MQEAEVVPRRRIVGIDGDDLLVRLHRFLPALGIAVPPGRALEPLVSGRGRRDERPDQPERQGLASLALEVIQIEVEEALPCPRIEAHGAVGGHDASTPHGEPQLAEGARRPWQQPPRALEREPHLAHAGPGLEEGGGHARPHQVAEAIARFIWTEQPQAAELGRALRAQAEQARQLPRGEDAFGRASGGGQIVHALPGPRVSA